MSGYGPQVTGLEAGRRYRVVVPQKLPLGGSVDGKRQPGLFRVYVPSGYGGKLTLETSAGRIEVRDPKGQPARDASGQPVAAARKVEFEVPLGGHGWYGLVVTGAATYRLSSRFVIEGNSRDADGSLIAPWHFYYFPYTDVVKQGSNHPAARYDQRFGTKAYQWESSSFWKKVIETGNTGAGGQAGHAITPEYCDEINKWLKERGIDAEYKYEDCWWWGHCDAAATASALFKQPVAAQGFSEADLEYMATEVAMRGYRLELRFYLGGLNNTSRRHPSHTEIPRPDAKQALDKDIGPYHEALIQLVKNEGGCALSDLRADYQEGKDRSPDVWNQIVYKFRMELQQAEPDGPGKDEEQLARACAVTTVIYANGDTYDSHGDPESRPEARWERHIDSVLHFDAKGRIAVDHPENNCKKCYWGNNQYYLPRYIFAVKGLGASRPNGNPEITLDRIKQLGVSLRAVFGG